MTRTATHIPIPTDSESYCALVSRFMRFVIEEENTGCWIWIGAVNSKHYPCFGIAGNRSVLAHRLSWRLFRGDIPAGLEIDHRRCDQKVCVNPNHLELATTRDNVLRSSAPSARNRLKVFCHRGHPLSGPNLFVTNKGRRECLTCMRTYRREWAARRRGLRRARKME